MEIKDFQLLGVGVKYIFIEDNISLQVLKKKLEEDEKFTGELIIEESENNQKILSCDEGFIELDGENMQIALLVITPISIGVISYKVPTIKIEKVVKYILDQIPKTEEYKIKEVEYRTSVKIKNPNNIDSFINQDLIKKFSKISSLFPEFNNADKNLYTSRINFTISPKIDEKIALKYFKDDKEIETLDLEIYYEDMSDYLNNTISIIASLSDMKLKKLLSIL